MKWKNKRAGILAGATCFLILTTVLTYRIDPIRAESKAAKTEQKQEATANPLETIQNRQEALLGTQKQTRKGAVVDGGDPTYDLYDENGVINPGWVYTGTDTKSGEIKLGNQEYLRYTFGPYLSLDISPTPDSLKLSTYNFSLIPSVFFIDKNTDARPVNEKGVVVNSFSSLETDDKLGNRISSSSPFVISVTPPANGSLLYSTFYSGYINPMYVSDNHANVKGFMAKLFKYYYKDLPDGSRLLKQVAVTKTSSNLALKLPSSSNKAGQDILVEVETTMIPKGKRVLIERKVTNIGSTVYPGFTFGSNMDAALLENMGNSGPIPFYYVGNNRGLYIQREIGTDNVGKPYGYRMDFLFTDDHAVNNWRAGTRFTSSMTAGVGEMYGTTFNRFPQRDSIGDETLDAPRDTNALPGIAQQGSMDTMLFMKTQPVDLAPKSYIRTSYYHGISLMEAKPEITFAQEENAKSPIIYYDQQYTLNGRFADTNDDRTKLELKYSVDGGEEILVKSWNVPETDGANRENGESVVRVDEPWSLDISKYLADDKDHTFVFTGYNGVTEESETVVFKYNRTPELAVNAANAAFYDGSKLVDRKYPILIDYKDEDSSELTLHYEVLPFDADGNLGEPVPGPTTIDLTNEPLNTLHEKYAVMIPDAELQSKKQRVRFWIEDKNRVTDKESETAYFDIEREPKPTIAVDLKVAKPSVLQGTANSYTATVKTSGHPDARFHDPKLITEPFDARVTPDTKSVTVTVNGVPTSAFQAVFDTETRQLTVSLTGFPSGLGIDQEIVVTYNVNTTSNSAGGQPIEQAVTFTGTSSKAPYADDKSATATFTIVDKMAIAVRYFVIDPNTGQLELQKDLSEDINGEHGEEIEIVAKEITGYTLSDTKIDGSSVGTVQKPKVKIGTNTSLEFIYEGALELSSAPTVIDFGNQKVSAKNLFFDNPKYDRPLVVYDNRSQTTEWRILLKQSGNLSIPGDPSAQLVDALSYQTSTDNKTLSTENQEVFRSKVNTRGKFDVSKDTWGPGKEGLRLDIPAGKVKQVGDYETTLTWTIEEVY
ncbi:WxL domain-containing protein [Enterococcus sp. DIV0242_7C1]|uniref:WxL domain-containing protein n=1 Tax=Candidatus Enterococcus dunnyi TaxID=1834192 RepID=A0A200JCL9_9ENTE|nr:MULTISPECIES: WxL domain-containing protein [unclassified Enterococcus]MBO0471754.1 WxL domain-containing protein [Enterococcus sp. DIV0242_7C1]OUZ34611.1 hypothetical protein A5889_000086 [Enterococcus sp. 9D6_DIV0238]